MPSTKWALAYVAATYSPVASPTFTGTVTLPASTTLTTPILTTPTITAPAGSGFQISKTIAFVEDATSTTHTGTVVLPAGCTLLNIQIVTTVLWGGGTAALIVGDADDPDGWFVSTDLKATDLLVGEVLDISNAENWGGKQGVYMDATTGRKGTSGVAGNSGVYYGVAKSIIGVVAVGTPAATTGRTFMTVTYSIGSPTVATAA